ncbi:MAG: ComEC/Rec2 family competence protein, partial [Phycisphaerae bacterium]
MEALRNASCAITHAAPLFPVAVGMIAGVVADEHQRPGVAAYAVVFLVVGGLSLVRRVRALAGPLLIPAASVCVGGLLHFSTMRISAPASVERHIGPSRTIVRLRGTVAGLPRVHPPRPNAFARWMVTETRSAFVLETAGIETTDGYVPVSGRLRVNVHEPVLDLREGERVEVFGWLRRLDPPANPGSFNWAAYWRRRGIVGQMS